MDYRTIPCVLSASMCMLPALSQHPARPNILLCVADDAGHMGAYGYSWVNTPAFDSIAAHGVLFDNAFTCNAKSGPSRACMITGRNSWQLEEAGNHWCRYPQKFTSLSEVLEAAGYETGFTGKGWGPGIAENPDGSERRLTGKKYNKRKLVPPTTGISNVDYAANFADFLARRDKSRPFCFWYGAREPHRAYEFGSSVKNGKNTADIDTVPAYWPDNATVRTDMLDYALEIEHFDAHLGRIIAMLDSVGELDNTLVIVTSDHGMPFPRVKGQNYYQSNHIPLAVMWGDCIRRPGRRASEAVSVIDFVPTILEATGVDGLALGMQPVTGRSFADILRDSTDTGIDRSCVLMGKERHDVGRPDDQGYPIRAILKGRYLYIHNYEPQRWPACNPETGYMNVDGSPTKTEIIRARRSPDTEYLWELSMGFRPEIELYDIESDVFCMHNLASDPAMKDTVAALERELTGRLVAEGDPRMQGRGDVFDRYPNMCPQHQYYNRTKAGEKIATLWINPTDFDTIE